MTPLPNDPGAAAAVTVVIVTRDRLDELRRTLHHLTLLPDRPAVTVVDNGSRADTAAAVTAAFPAVRVVSLERNAGCYGRNVGAACATTPLVAFSDDDSWWAPGALRHAAELFARHQRLGLAAARILVGPDNRLDPVCRLMAGSALGTEPDLPGPTLRGFVACGAVVRRAAFLDAGGFTERYGIGGEEDLLAVDLARAGWGLAYADSLVAHHHPSPSRDPAGRRRRVVRNDLWTTWLRRRRPAALRRTARIVQDGWRDPATWLGAADALRGLPWVARARRPVPAWLERELALLE